ncbi:hypothetical protein Hdeb2414_s0019g00543251 [Helianthus debilis subsp. tardiflorus]
MVAIWCIVLNSVKIADSDDDFRPETCSFCRKLSGNLLETMKKKSGCVFVAFEPFYG